MGSAIRPPAVAGTFYPREPRELLRTLRTLLTRVQIPNPPRQPPRAIIVPHAGYVYSGEIAAAAYARLLHFRSAIKKVILFGPAHREAVDGIAVPNAGYFSTPLGEVPIPPKDKERLAAFPQIRFSDSPHQLEHSLEVQLPFLQLLFGTFSLVPLLVGRASPQEVYEIIEAFWRDADTLMIISTDLSHFLDYESARTMDKTTIRAIENLEFSSIGFDQACGRVPLSGMLLAAREKNLRIETLEIKNSGDTAGPRDSVVGYGSWMLTEPEPSTLEQELIAHSELLLSLARQSIEYALKHQGSALPLDISKLPPVLQQPAACFVSLHLDGRLRGCIGNLEGHRALAQELLAHAASAAFADPRFPPLTEPEYARIQVEISVLGAVEALETTSENALLEQVRAGKDGLILQEGNHRATFLPVVWEQLPRAEDFLRELKQKAGLSPDYWSDTLSVWRYPALLLRE